MSFKLFSTILLFPLFSNQVEARCSINSTLREILLGNQGPKEVEIITTDLSKANKKIWEQAKNGETFSYWVDINGTLRFSKLHPVSNRPIVIVKDQATQEGLLVKEQGFFSFDLNTKKPVYTPEQSMDLVDGEIDDAIRTQTEGEYTRINQSHHTQGRVFKCSEMLAAKAAGKSFVFDNLVSTALVTSGATVAVKFSKWDKNHTAGDSFWTWERFKLLPYDLTANLLSTSINSTITKKLIYNKGAGVTSNFLWDTGTDFATSIVIKRPIYNSVHSKEEIEKKEKLGNELVYYDTGYSTFRFFPKRMFNMFMKDNYEKNMISTCINHPAAYFIAGPKTVRMIEKGSWAYFYYLGREFYKPENEQ